MTIIDFKSEIICNARRIHNIGSNSFKPTLGLDIKYEFTKWNFQLFN